MTIEKTIKKAMEGGFDLGKYGNDGRRYEFNGFFMPNNWKVEISTKITYSDERFKSDQSKNCNFWIHITQITSDPSFWQSLGKAMGWDGNRGHDLDLVIDWKYKWHKFIDHLAEEKTAEEYFKEL